MPNLAAYTAKPVRIGNLCFCWYGLRQWYKWRWNVTHVDLGPLSIYGIKRPALWLPLRLAIWPLRQAYGLYVRSPKVQERNRRTLGRSTKQRAVEDAWKR